MRIFKSKCTENKSYPGEHAFELHSFEDAIGKGEDSKCCYCGMPSKDMDTVWDKIENIYLTMIPYDYRLKNVWYTFKCWAWERHTTIKPRTLSHKWCDKVELLPHMVFEILCKFVEEELGPERTRVEQSQDDWQKAYKEMDELYNWWTKEYPILQKDLWSNKNYTLEKETAFDNLVTANAKRVLDVRPYMWT